MKLLNDENARLLAGCATTGAILAAGHHWPWWRPLNRLAAYTFGCGAILLGQGIPLKFNKQWRRLCAIVVTAGGVVVGTYLLDARATLRARHHATGGGSNGA